MMLRDEVTALVPTGAEVIAAGWSGGHMRQLLTTILALAIVPLTGCVSGGSHERFPSAYPGTQRPDKIVRLSGDLYRPGHLSGPTPAVVILHGCNGMSSAMVNRALWLNSLGYIALAIDSHGPRNLGDLCNIPGLERGIDVADRAYDALGGLRYLRTLPFVDGRRVAVVGWSAGGGPALLAANELLANYVLGSDGFRAAVAFYPACSTRSLKNDTRTPLLVLMGSLDTWPPPAVCQELLRVMKADGAPVVSVTYPGAYHGFDVPRGAVGYRAGHTIAYDHVAAQDAERQVAAFLKQWLR